MVLVAWTACRPHPPPVPHVSSPSSAETADSGGSTGTSLGPWIPPSVHLYGEPTQRIDLGFHAIRAHGGNPGTLFVPSGSAPPPYPQTFAQYPPQFLLSGDLPRGEHPIASVWDGVSGVAFFAEFVTAGDLDGDSHIDLWSSDARLYRGPFLGRELKKSDHVLEAECCWDPVLGDFDADGDGVLDVMFGGGLQMGMIHHGPFEGTIPLWYDSPESSVLGLDGCQSGDGAVIVKDYFGPGQDAVGMGLELGHWCSPDTYFFPLQGPRGRRLTFDDAFASSESFRDSVVLFYGIDVDRDGDSEVLAGTDRFLQVYESPVTPSFWNTPLAWDLGDELVADAIGDLDGNGQDDLVVQMGASGDVGDKWYGLLLAPFDLTAPIADHVIPLTPGEPPTGDALVFHGVGEIAMDLDGDGIPDLMDLQDGPDDAGYISIWYGADLLSAIQSRSER